MGEPPRDRTSHWRARCWETSTAGSEGDRAEKDPHFAGTSPHGRPYVRHEAPDCIPG